MHPDQDDITHSNPITIDSSGGHHRRRSSSLSSDSSGSPTTPLTTPISSNPPKVSTVSPSTSPILSYFMSQSPTAKTFPFRRGTISSFGANSGAFEEEEIQDPEPNPNKVHRRASTAWAGSDRFQPQPPPLMGDNRHERATGLLRRLSLSTPFTRAPIVTTGFGAGDQNPAAPPNTAYPQSPSSPNNRPNRTLSPGRRPIKRAPSPMGERILKGHFDGFN